MHWGRAPPVDNNTGQGQHPAFGAKIIRTWSHQQKVTLARVAREAAAANSLHSPYEH